MRNFLINFSVLIYCLIPLALLTGPFLPDLFISTLGVIFLYFVISSKNWEYFKNAFSYFFLLFFIYLLISSLFSEFPIFSLKSSLVYFRYGLFVLATWYLLDTNKYFFKYFKYALLITFLLALLDGYYQYIFGIGISGIKVVESARLNLTFDDKLILGGYLARLFPLLLALLILENKGSKNFLFLALVLILTDVLVYLSGERTALGLLLITTVCLILFLTKFKILRIFTFLISISCIILFSYMNPNIKERNIDVTINQLGINEGSDKINIFSPQHESHYIGAWRVFLDNKFLGAGPNNYRNLCNNPKFNLNIMTCSTHPHNTYIQLLAETGILGFLMISSIFIIILYYLLIHFVNTLTFKKPFFTEYQVCLIICFVLSLFPFLPSQNFFNNWINIIYFLPIGFFLSSIYSKVGE